MREGRPEGRHTDEDHRTVSGAKKLEVLLLLIEEGNHEGAEALGKAIVAELVAA